ncbi:MULTISPECIES: NF038104 family lipoprotein [Corallincola]|uniref:NF038104 family lipoprotein n=1 Tax=Corallincola TaxID=1775176 RepID=UPI0013EEB981|nr:MULTISPECIES: NF038104 family lipoprotein [Corallincola]
MQYKAIKLLLASLIIVHLSGCVAAAVVGTAVGVTTSVVGGAVDVADAVTPDIIDDDD